MLRTQLAGSEITTATLRFATCWRTVARPSCSGVARDGPWPCQPQRGWQQTCAGSFHRASASCCPLYDFCVACGAGSLADHSDGGRRRHAAPRQQFLQLQVHLRREVSRRRHAHGASVLQEFRQQCGSRTVAPTITMALAEPYHVSSCTTRLSLRNRKLPWFIGMGWLQDITGSRHTCLDE